MNTELLPCPFCGAGAKSEVRDIGGGSKGYWIGCSDCRIFHPVGESTYSAAILRWNRRTLTPEVPAVGIWVDKMLANGKRRRLIVAQCPPTSPVPFAAALDLPDIDIVVNAGGSAPTDALAALNRILASKAVDMEKHLAPKIVPLNPPEDKA